MAVRFSADAQDYTATVSGLSDPFTITCWGMVVVDRNAFSTFWSIDNNTINQFVILQTTGTGTNLILSPHQVHGSDVTGPNLTVGTWYRMAVVRNGTSATLYTGVQGATLATASANDWDQSTFPRTRVGESVFNAEWLNGRVAALKMWSAALTAGEVTTELNQYVPARTTNLVRSHPFIGADVADYSGNGNNFTATGAGATTEDGPPILWSSSAPIPTPVPARRAANF